MTGTCDLPDTSRR